MNRTATRVALFIAFAFALDWGLVFVYDALGGKWVMPNNIILGVVYMFGPLAAAIIVQKAIYKEPVVGPLGVSFRLNRWFLVAWLLPPLIAIAIFGVSLLFPDVRYASDPMQILERFRSAMTPEQFERARAQAASLPLHPFWLALLQGLIAGATVNAVAGFGEELGWRGFLQGELSPLGFWKSSALIGLIWGFWHAPLILKGHNYPQHPVAGVFLMAAWCVLLAPLLGYVRLRAKSVMAAAVMHGTVNGTFGLSMMLLQGGNDLLIGFNGLAGFIVLAVANLGIFAYERFLAKTPAPGGSPRTPA